MRTLPTIRNAARLVEVGLAETRSSPYSRVLFSMATGLMDRVEDRLSWYNSVRLNEKPAKYLLCKLTGTETDPTTLTDSQLWNEHGTLHKRFVTRWRGVKDGSNSGIKQPSERFSLLDVKHELLNRILRKCVLCEWKCKVNRAEGKKGACRLGTETRVATFFRHFGEETPLVGRKGSGTIFFTGCTFRCVFCQNWDISQDPTAGKPVTPTTLASIMSTLRDEDAANINLVGGEPTPHLHTILKALTITKVNVPILWNSNLYLTYEAMEILADVVDIWLPDFKWGNDGCAVKYSRVTRYFEVVSRNHRIAQDSGDMIIRHLVIPGHVECCTKRVLEWVAEFCPRAIVNVMGQYRPQYLVAERPQDYAEIARCPRDEELEEAGEYARKLGLACLA